MAALPACKAPQQPRHDAGNTPLSDQDASTRRALTIEPTSFCSTTSVPPAMANGKARRSCPAHRADHHAHLSIERRKGTGAARRPQESRPQAGSAGDIKRLRSSADRPSHDCNNLSNLCDELRRACHPYGTTIKPTRAITVRRPKLEGSVSSIPTVITTNAYVESLHQPGNPMCATAERRQSRTTAPRQHGRHKIDWSIATLTALCARRYRAGPEGEELFMVRE